MAVVREKVRRSFRGEELATRVDVLVGSLQQPTRTRPNTASSHDCALEADNIIQFALRTKHEKACTIMLEFNELDNII